MCAFVCACECSYSWRPREAVGSCAIGILGSWSHHVGAGTKPGSSGKATQSVSHWAGSQPCQSLIGFDSDVLVLSMALISTLMPRPEFLLFFSPIFFMWLSLHYCKIIYILFLYFLMPRTKFWALPPSCIQALRTFIFKVIFVQKF